MIALNSANNKGGGTFRYWEKDGGSGEQCGGGKIPANAPGPGDFTPRKRTQGTADLGGKKEKSSGGNNQFKG